jgi:hypothetical protein
MRGRAFRAAHRVYGAVAQLGERRVRNAKVEGSIPFRSTSFFLLPGTLAFNLARELFDLGPTRGDDALDVRAHALSLTHFTQQP